MHARAESALRVHPMIEARHGATASFTANGAKKKQFPSSAIEGLFSESRWSLCSIELTRAGVASAPRVEHAFYDFCKHSLRLHLRRMSWPSEDDLGPLAGERSCIAGNSGDAWQTRER
jgi:hypothetical protein